MQCAQAAQWESLALRNGWAVSFLGGASTCADCACGARAGRRSALPVDNDTAVGDARNVVCPAANTRAGHASDADGIGGAHRESASGARVAAATAMSRVAIGARCSGGTLVQLCCTQAVQALVCSGVQLASCSCDGAAMACSDTCALAEPAPPPTAPRLAPFGIPLAPPAGGRRVFTTAVVWAIAMAVVIFCLYAALSFGAICVAVVLGRARKARDAGRVAEREARTEEYRDMDKRWSQRRISERLRQVQEEDDEYIDRRLGAMAPTPVLAPDGRPRTKHFDRRMLFDGEDAFYEVTTPSRGAGVLMGTEPTLFRDPSASPDMWD